MRRERSVPYSGKFSSSADFTDRLVSVKINTMGVVTSCKKVSLMLELRSIEELKPQKYFLKDYGVIPRKLI